MFLLDTYQPVSYTHLDVYKRQVFVDNGQYRLAVAMQKTKEPIYLPLSNEALKWMPEREEMCIRDSGK